MKKIIIIVCAIVFLFILMIIGSSQTKKRNEVPVVLNFEEKEIDGQTVYELEEKQFVVSEKETNLVKIDVKDAGIMIAELYPKIAPITVKNFKTLINEGFYDNLTFHRVIKDFMIQTGDPTGTGSGGTEKTIKGEFKNNGVKNTLSHTRGVLSMARAGGNPDTAETMNSATSQFFIVHADSDFLDGNYAAFGKVIYGLDVIDKVANVKTDEYDAPVVEQILSNIKYVSEYNGNK